MEELCELLPDSAQADLDTENTPDGMDGEQTWPTEDELAEVEEGAEEVKRKTVKIPRGTSDYQAAWIMEAAGQADSGDEEEEEDSQGEDEEGDEAMAVPAETLEEEEDDEESGGEDSEAEEGGEEEMMEDKSETVANTEDYDAKHVKLRCGNVILIQCMRLSPSLVLEYDIF